MTLSTCDVLLTLIPSLQVDILVSWLTLKDVGRLDSAICSTQHRELLLGVYKEEFCVFKETSKNNFGYLLWINQRRIKMADVEVPRPFNHPNVHPTFFEVTGKYLRRLNASSMFDIVEDDNANNVLSEKLAMLRTCVNLRQLELRYVDLRSLDIGPLLASFPHLRHLNLANCKNVSSDVVVSLTRQVKNLQVLDLSNCQVSDEINVDLLTPNHTIQTIHLGNVKKTPAFVAFALQCKELCALYVEGILLSDVYRLLTDCPILRILSAKVDLESHSEMLTAEQANALIPLMQKLECLHLYNVSGRYVADEQLVSIVANSPNLSALLVTNINIDSRDGRTLDNILDTAMSVTSGTSCVHKLNTLCVGAITTATLQTILHHCPQLSTLVHRSTWADTETRGLLATIGQSTISSLSMNTFNPIPSADLLHLRNLVRLQLDSYELTDNDVMGLVDRNPKLRVLSLSDSPLLTKKSVLYIVKNCKYLEELKFDNVNPSAPPYNRTVVDTSLLTDVVLFFRPKLKKLVINLVHDQPEDSFY